MKTPLVVIVDTGNGNTGSVLRAVKRLGCRVQCSAERDIIVSASHIVLPGVGQFASGMAAIEQLKLQDTLQEAARIRKIPILGICLGMQLMARYSEEGDVQGLGWFNAETVKFDVKNVQRFKIPHIGWNTLVVENEHPLLKGIHDDDFFYFVHSYHVVCNEVSDSLATTEYAYPFTSVIGKENIMGVQFHPEKSYEAGDVIFSNFLKI